MATFMQLVGGFRQRSYLRSISRQLFDELCMRCILRVCGVRDDNALSSNDKSTAGTCYDSCLCGPFDVLRIGSPVKTNR